MENSQYECPNMVKDVSLKELRERLEEFARVRGWEQYHSPRNLLLALVIRLILRANSKEIDGVEIIKPVEEVGEVGELSEIFQWKGEVEKGLPNWSLEDKKHLEDELSDVLLYLIQLANVCGLDLGQAALAKMVKNAQKYPIN